MSVFFKAVGKKLTYAKRFVPLTREIFKTGDVVSDLQGVSIEITQVHHSGGLIPISVSIKLGKPFRSPKRNWRIHAEGERPSGQ